MLPDSIEDRITEARKWLARFPKAKMAEAAKKFGVADWTLRRRLNGILSPTEANAKKRLLTDAQEAVLTAWVADLGRKGRGLTRTGIRVKVQELCGRKPSDRWVDDFQKRSVAAGRGIHYRRPKRLDPTRAKCFNEPTVDKHFRELQEIKDKYNIKVENTYNMDEKGIQLGGGRNGRGNEKTFFSTDDTARYKIRSDDLELVTILECVCADGTSLTPGFVFAGATFEQEWFEVPGYEKVT